MNDMKYILNGNVSVTPHGTHVKITINKDKYIVEVNDIKLLEKLAYLSLQAILERKNIDHDKWASPPPKYLFGKDTRHQQYIKLSSKDKKRLGYK
tara:strand:- start:319 stop:603 length:285 start_codon:yes stop_codon:yes gene_type:complete